ncbi:MAG: hypothetical protein RL407_614 [Bacteroidota bacterium]|jgi:uncharacterized repeat protein (TIGR03806 family)
MIKEAFKRIAKKGVILLLLLELFASCAPQASEQEAISASLDEVLVPEEADGKFPYERLSTYGFFEGEIASLRPSASLIPYQPASSLFTDYALKSRFASLPEGTQASLEGEELHLPQGTILIKNFYYPADFRMPEEERRIIETRLLIHEENGWEAYPYLWNESQTDAVLKVVGAEKEVRFINTAGEEQVINYLVPNKNQCKSCHNKNESLAPLGVQTRHLNHDFEYKNGTENQLAHWTKIGKLVGFEGKSAHPSLVNYEDSNQALNDRAMAYLDINCSHCHRAEGPASTSGLFLTYGQKDPLKLGVYKTPVAAGKGSGSHTYDIVPGDGDASILLHRMNSTEIGVAMPELGRTSIHTEGVALIRAWINRMDSK